MLISSHSFWYNNVKTILKKEIKLTMTNTIISIISSLGISTILAAPAGILIKFVLDNQRLKAEDFSNNISKKLSKEILEPFQFSIEMSLFKLIIDKNKKQTTSNQIQIEHALFSIKQLQKKINSDSLIFSYMNDIFLENLSTTIILMESDNPNIKKINKNYQAFSATYFQILNQVRKSNFLPQRGDNYRITFHLYKQKNVKNFRRKRSFDSFLSKTILIIVFSTAIPFLIVSIAHVIIAVYELFVLLY